MDTPDCWRIMRCQNSSAPDSVDVILEKYNGLEFICTTGDWDNEKAQKCARLISAAPDLLSAAKEAYDITECNCGEKCDGSCTHATLLTAINKVEDDWKGY